MKFYKNKKIKTNIPWQMKKHLPNIKKIQKS